MMTSGSVCVCVCNSDSGDSADSSWWSGWIQTAKEKVCFTLFVFLVIRCINSESPPFLAAF